MGATRNLLVVYRVESFPLRGTVEDHLRSFRRYAGRRSFYLNLGTRQPPRWLGGVPFDLVVFHNSFLSGRWSPPVFEALKQRAQPLKGLGAKRVAMPQDEFFRTEDIERFVDEFQVDVIYSVAPESEWGTIYPSVDRERVRLERGLTGYLDEDTVRRIERITRERPTRTIDIGYRARRHSPWLGRHGQLKAEIADTVADAAPAHGLTVDISTRDQDTFLGDDWFRFLAGCKYTVGVEGGASVLDADGSLRELTEEFTRRNPDAGLDEIEARCFAGRDGELQLKALSPRHLEACATRTCQILVEGSYNEVLRPGEHYLELKSDLSNLSEVLATAARDDRRQELTNAAYRDVVASGAWTYARMVGEVESFAPDGASQAPSRKAWRDGAIRRLDDVLNTTSEWRTRWWLPRRAAIRHAGKRLLRR